MAAHALGGAWAWINHNPRRRTIAIVAALVLAAAAGWGINQRFFSGDPCGAGYYRGVPRECIGVSDGSYDFLPELHDVDQAILKENRSALSQATSDHSQVATVALLVPLTGPSLRADILHEVQGAYIAQYYDNHHANGQQPPIRLVLANPGANSAHYLPVVQELRAMEGAPDNLRAVAGISVSTRTTKKEVAWLTSHHVPVVGGAITADDIANTPGSEPFPGFARVEPTNDQEARALAEFGDVNPRQAIVVQDSRTDDDYISTLAKEFDRDSAYQPVTFQSAQDVNKAGDTANTFANVTVPEICPRQQSEHIRWIYFAGRQVQLRLFVNALAAGCQGDTFTIVTGSAASHLTNDASLDAAAFRKGITLEYAAIASPTLWAGVGPRAYGRSASGWAGFASAVKTDSGTRRGQIGPVSLTDGQAIINYDAVLTAIGGIRALTNGGGLPSPRTVGNGWGDISGPRAVSGASGQICLDNAGNPYDKPVPVVRYSPSGAPAAATPAWPNGHPPLYPCYVPRNG